MLYDYHGPRLFRLILRGSLIKKLRKYWPESRKSDVLIKNELVTKLISRQALVSSIIYILVHIWDSLVPRIDEQTILVLNKKTPAIRLNINFQL